MSRLKTQLRDVGELSDMIGLITRTEVLDDYGALRVTDPAGTADTYAQVRYVNTNEGDSAVKQEKFIQEVKVWLRYDSTINKEKLVYWNSSYWDIYAIEHTPGYRFHVLKCRLIEQ